MHARHPGQIYTVVKYYIRTQSYVGGNIIDGQDIDTIQFVNFNSARTNPKSVILTHGAESCTSAKGISVSIGLGFCF